MSTEGSIPGPRLVQDAADSAGSPREVRVLAFEPDTRPGEWRARQMALRRSAAALTSPPTQSLPPISPPRPRKTVRGVSPAAGSLPIRLPNGGAGSGDVVPPVQGRKVGVEIAPVEPMAADRARYFLTLAEQKLQVPERNTIWTIKEAAWKALECEGPTPFTAMELRFDDYGSLREVSLEGRLFPAGALVLSPWPEYILAVVWIDGNAR